MGGLAWRPRHYQRLNEHADLFDEVASVTVDSIEGINRDFLSDFTQSNGSRI